VGKEGHKTPAQKDDEGTGDAYTFVAIERHHKLVVNFTMGKRNQQTTDAFIEGLRHATSGKQHFQVTTDGFQPYVSAITTTLSDRCDYAMHIKVYGANQDGERRYSPAEVISSEKVPVMGNPEKKRICTSHIERQNLTMRMQMRRIDAPDERLQQEVGETLGAPTACGSPTTTSAGFTRPCALRLRWKRGLRLAFGKWRTCWHSTALSDCAVLSSIG
jgi:IS1 family transposase